MRVLVTGAAGQIGAAFVDSCAGGALEVIRSDLVDRHPDSAFPFRRLDVTDPDACREVCRDVDGILHLAADPDPDADFRTSVLPVNVVGTYNLATSAVENGVSRFVFASSAQAVAGYPSDHQVRETDAPRPANDYGVGKAFGEAMCARLAVRSATTFVSVRIGNYASDRPTDRASWRDRAAWLSPRDANQLLRLALTKEVDGHAVVNGVSDNAAKLLSLVGTSAALGYAPVDDAFADPPAEGRGGGHPPRPRRSGPA